MESEEVSECHKVHHHIPPQKNHLFPNAKAKCVVSQMGCYLLHYLGFHKWGWKCTHGVPHQHHCKVYCTEVGLCLGEMGLWLGLGEHWIWSMLVGKKHRKLQLLILGFGLGLGLAQNAAFLAQLCLVCKKPWVKGGLLELGGLLVGHKC